MQAEDDGLRLLREIKSGSPQTPVIRYTGYARIPDAILAGKLGRRTISNSLSIRIAS
jgi:DNA-binding NtrC family response regulator